jgi:hypothetical protein
MTMSFQDELEKVAGRSGGRPIYRVGNRNILFVNARGKKVGWYVRKGSMKNEKGPFKTLKEARAAK